MPMPNVSNYPGKISQSLRPTSTTIVNTSLQMVLQVTTWH